MSLIDKHFKDAVKNLPEQKLSWAADRHIKKSIRHRARQLDGKSPFWMSLKRFVAVPVAFALLLTTTGAYGYLSPSVVQGDLLYPIKTELENRWYPQDASSEVRVAYHLKLSQRRYAEVQEILQRRLDGQKTASLVFAQGLTVDPLDDILVKTLQRATQHMEYAFLVTDEIREIETVQKVQVEIRKTIASQKVVLEKVTPVLKEVKFSQKPKARKKRSKDENKTSQILKVSEAEVVVAESETLKKEEVVKALPVPEKLDETVNDDTLFFESNDPEVIHEGETEGAPSLEAFESFMVEAEVTEDLDDAADFFLDRLSFQEDLLVAMDESVEKAQVLGVAEVELEVSEDLEVIAETEVNSDKVFIAALAGHYKKQQLNYKNDLVKLDGKLVAGGDNKDLEEEDTDLDDEENDDSKFLPTGDSGEIDETLIAVVDEDLIPDESLESASVSIAATDLVSDQETPLEEPGEKSLDPEDADIEELLESDEGEEESIIAAEDSTLSATISGGDIIINDPVVTPLAVTSELVEEVLVIDDEKKEPVFDPNIAHFLADGVPFGGGGVAEIDLENMRALCRETLRLVCEEYALDGCLKKVVTVCESTKDQNDIKTFVSDAKKRLDALQAEKDKQDQEEVILEEMNDKRSRILELDVKIEKLQTGTTKSLSR